MERADAALLYAVSCAVKGKQIEDDPGLSEAEWVALLKQASQHEMLPLVFEAVMRCKSFTALDRDLREGYRRAAVQLAVRQITQTNEFLNLMLRMEAAGLRPAVLKGIAVRRLYPKPMLRPSVDEDLIVRPEETRAVHEFLLREGLTPDKESRPVDGSGDLSYHRPDSPTYIELHTAFFPAESEAYADCNAPFEGAWERMEEIEAEDVRLLTLSPTDHLLYLMLHAYKHFLHSGMGLRHVCDICVFAANHETDPERVRSVCDGLGLTRLFAAVFEIGRDRLGFEPYPAFRGVEVDTEPLLYDMLTGGLFGVEDINRAHSSTLTLEAVASHKAGRRSRGALHSVFLPKSALEGRYPYLKKHGWLLPAAWVQRGWSYLFSREGGPVNPAESLRIGRERVELLRKYGIID